MGKILIIGAGAAGEIIAREILSKSIGQIIGFLDDDPTKRSENIQGHKVLGTVSEASHFIDKYDVNQVIIAIPSASGPTLKKIVNLLLPHSVDIKIVPGYYDLKRHDIEIDYPIRDVDVTDLLGRKNVELDISSISSYIEKKVILITGAGGSIGQELSKLVANLNPKSLLLLGRGENSIFGILNDIKFLFPSCSVFPIIANITDHEELENIFKTFHPQVIFHAAAHKHVDLMEKHPREAFKNNVIGTYNLIQLSLNYKIERFVQISTDKAVNPESVMGATKRITELLIQSHAENEITKFCSVRFGNVLGSRGSVVPIFKKQILQGGPVTVRHPDVYRYFMTIPEACQLVLQAGSMALKGEVFILDMGEPIRILDLAKQLIQLYSKDSVTDIPITFTGLLPGEKLEEELLTDQEGLAVTRHKNIMVTPPDIPDKKEILSRIQKIKGNLYIFNSEELKQAIFDFCKEFTIKKVSSI